MKKKFLIQGEHQMRKLGAMLAKAATSPLIINLVGQLGAGKTTLARGFMCELGYTGKVKSPTYTLVEEYKTPTINAQHFDLYRITNPEELEYIGLQDYLDGKTHCLIEWPENGHGLFPICDIECIIEFAADRREVAVNSHSAAGTKTLEKMKTPE